MRIFREKRLFQLRIFVHLVKFLPVLMHNPTFFPLKYSQVQ